MLRRAAGAALALVCGFALLLAWRMPYEVVFDHPRARVALSEPAFEALTRPLAWIDEEVPPDALLALIPGHPIYWFLSARPLPYRYGIFLPHNVRRGGQALVDEIEGRRIDYVLAIPPRMPGVPDIDSFAPLLAAYLRDHFEVVREHPTGQRLLRRPAASGSWGRRRFAPVGWP